jgi:hypothetical protein
MTDNGPFSGTQFLVLAVLFPVLYRTPRTIRLSRPFGMHLHLTSIVYSSDRIIGGVAQMLRKSGFQGIILVTSALCSRGMDV